MTVVQPERYAGDLWCHPDKRLGSPLLRYEPARPEQRTRGGQLARAARPATVTLCGPIGGQLECDPERLRYEAQRLLDAADTLDTIRAREPLAAADGQGVLSV